MEKPWADYYSHIQDPAEKSLAKMHDDAEALGKKNLATAVTAVGNGDWDAAEHLLIGQVAKNHTAAGIASNELSAHIALRGCKKQRQQPKARPVSPIWP